MTAPIHPPFGPRPPSLSDIACHATSVGALLGAGVLRPAQVQRDYQWGEAEASILLDDLERALAAHEAQSFAGVDDEDAADSAEEAEDAEHVDDDAPDRAEPEGSAWGDFALRAQPAAAARPAYFLGAMVLGPPADPEAADRDVFDGLQRLTTVTTLAAVLRDLADADGDAATADAMHALVACADGAPRLTLPSADKTFAQRVQARGEAAKARRSQPASALGKRIQTVALTYRAALLRRSTERRAALARFLIDGAHVAVVDFGSGRMARQAFVTTNVRGKPLKRADLLRGQVLDLATEDERDGVARIWSALELSLGDDWEPFLMAVDVLTRRSWRSSASLAELAHHLDVGVGEGSFRLIDWIERLVRQARAWRLLTAALRRPGPTALEADLWRLRFFQWPAWRPLAIHWIDDALQKAPAGDAAEPSLLATLPTRNRRLVARRFAKLHAACMTCMLVGYAPTDRETIFGKALVDAGRGRDPFRKPAGAPTASGPLTFRRDAQRKVRRALAEPLIDDDLRRALIRWYESTLWAGAPPGGIAFATVEHILPRNPKPESQWLRDFPDDAARGQAHHSLGNLALLDSDANAALENGDFSRKRHVFAQKASLFKTLVDVAAQKQWTSAEIDARAQTMTERVLAALDL